MHHDGVAALLQVRTTKQSFGAPAAAMPAQVSSPKRMVPGRQRNKLALDLADENLIKGQFSFVLHPPTFTTFSCRKNTATRLTMVNTKALLTGTIMAGTVAGLPLKHNERRALEKGVCTC